MCMNLMSRTGSMGGGAEATLAYHCIASIRMEGPVFAVMFHVQGVKCLDLSKGKTDMDL